MTFYQTSCWAPSEGEREKRRDRWEFAIILTKTFHTIHCESTLRVTRRQLRSHKGGWLLYQAGKRSNVCLAVPHGGHSALSIGRLMHSKYHKSFNGGHSRPFTVDFKDSWDENIRLVWILWPSGVYAWASCRELEFTWNTLEFFYFLYTHCDMSINKEKKKENMHTRTSTDTN